MHTPIATLPSLLLALTALCAAPLRGQGSGTHCPDQGASFVAAAGQDLAPWRTCYLQVRVVDIVISIAWQRCPTGRLYVPDHEECLGAFAPDSLCEQQGSVPIQLELCRCVPHAGSWYSSSRCECQPAGVMGVLDSGHTVECP